MSLFHHALVELGYQDACVSCRFSRENVDLAAALLTLACLGEGKEVSWAHEPHLRSLLGRHSIREASRCVLRTTLPHSCVPLRMLGPGHEWQTSSI